MTKQKIYGIITGETLNTSFGYDEETIAFESFKSLIENYFLQLEGDFLTSCEVGLGIFTAESVIACGKALTCVMPFENQASKWDNSQRERYFSIHEHSQKVVMLAKHYYDGCEKEAMDYIISNSDELIVVKGNNEKLSQELLNVTKKVTVVNCDDLTIKTINQ